MNRCFAAVLSSFALALAGVAHAASASAQPADAVEPSCVYTLSQAQVVQVSGAAMVTATLTPYPCTGSISPNSLTVCVQPEPNPASGQCGFSAIPTFAEVFVPYRPGTTYITQGTGCGSLYTVQGAICASVGPYRTTL